MCVVVVCVCARARVRACVCACVCEQKEIRLETAMPSAAKFKLPAAAQEEGPGGG